MLVYIDVNVTIKSRMRERCTYGSVNYDMILLTGQDTKKRITTKEVFRRKR